MGAHHGRAAADDLLARSPSQTTPLLLELARHQAQRRRPGDVLKQYVRDRFVAASPLDQRTLHLLDGMALDAAADFEALQLSPVAPLGACSVLAPTSQDRTLSSLRGTEVVSDPTNVLALECARRLIEQPAATVRLCTVHQVLRAQPVPAAAGFSRHFRLFALAEAGRSLSEDAFEVAAIVGHLEIFNRLFDACAALGWSVADRRATVYAAPQSAALESRVCNGLSQKLAHLAFTREPLTNPYYHGIRVVLGAHTATGDFVPLADTGVFDWVGRLTANRRMRFVASGVGLQLIPLRFGAARSDE